MLGVGFKSRGLKEEYLAVCNIVGKLVLGWSIAASEREQIGNNIEPRKKSIQPHISYN